MIKGTVTLGFLLLALSGCRAADVSELPQSASYKFDARLAVNPVLLQSNQRVSLFLEVTSASNRAVRTDIHLKVISEQNETMYESIWNDVLFHENEVWNLTQGFLPDSDAARKPWAVKILVRNSETNEVLFDQSIATLDFEQ